MPQPQHCLPVPGQPTSRMPHTSPSASGLRGLSQLRTGWSANTASYLNQIPAGPFRDVSEFDFLQFRAVVNFADGRNPGGMSQGLSVRLTDGFGGVDGLIDYLRAGKITAVVDATHPFAEHISANAAAATALAGVPLLRLERRGWRDHPCDPATDLVHRYSCQNSRRLGPGLLEASAKAHHLFVVV